mgnify:CR=1 FL=1
MTHSIKLRTQLKQTNPEREAKTLYFPHLGQNTRPRFPEAHSSSHAASPPRLSAASSWPALEGPDRTSRTWGEG